MSSTDIGWMGLGASLVLVVFAVLLSWGQRLRLERSMVWASVRAGVQLVAVGWALRLVLAPDASIAWSLLWVLAMVVFASFTVQRRASEVPGVLPLALVATGTVSVISLSVVFGFSIFPFEARTVVPIAGMVIGNSMTSAVVAARRVVGELRDKRLEVEARLALGQSSHDASRPYVRAALRTAMIPQIESTKAVGLVFLPGTMTGLILAGVDPFHAVTIQLAIMYLILGSVATSVTVIGVGLSRRLFTPDHRLVRLARTA